MCYEFEHASHLVEAVVPVPCLNHSTDCKRDEDGLLKGKLAWLTASRSINVMRLPYPSSSIK